MCERTLTKQAKTLYATLEEKKRAKLLSQTDPEAALKLLQQMNYRSTHRPQGITSTNAARARKFKIGHCEKCGAGDKLMIHHLNRNQSDNRPENIQTLCATCHRNIHRPRKKKEYE